MISRITCLRAWRLLGGVYASARTELGQIASSDVRNQQSARLMASLTVRYNPLNYSAFFPPVRELSVSFEQGDRVWKRLTGF